MHPDPNHVLYDVLEEALTYLECYELRRARKALMAEGGTPRPTAHELDRLRFFKECAERFGWTEAPSWVAMVESWS